MKFKNHRLNRLLNIVRYMLKPHRIRHYREEDNLEEAEKIMLERKERERLSGLKIGLARDQDQKPYYTKYQRFLENNDLDYQYFDIYRSSWLEEVENYDVIIWRPFSTYWELQEALEKIYLIEKQLKKWVFPSFAEIMFYENKIMQYYMLKNYGLPVVDTFISSSYDEVLGFIDSAEYPLVSKLRTGSGSSCVKLIENKRQAKRMTRHVFGRGEKTYWPFLRQKNYVLFQEYVENYGYDLRIIIIDKNHIFGYYRHPESDDFRASGTGIIIKKELPPEAMKIAYQTYEKSGFNMIAVDFVRRKSNGDYVIIECSYFIHILTCVQLLVDGVSGRYCYDKENDSFDFKQGKYWLQELTIKNFFQDISCDDKGV